VSIDISNESGVEADDASLVRLATFALDQLRIHPLAEVSILLVDEDTMSAYHEKYLGEPGPTDVLSFPMDELRPPTDGEELWRHPLPPGPRIVQPALTSEGDILTHDGESSSMRRIAVVRSLCDCRSIPSTPQRS